MKKALKRITKNKRINEFFVIVLIGIQYGWRRGLQPPSVFGALLVFRERNHGQRGADARDCRAHENASKGHDDIAEPPTLAVAEWRQERKLIYAGQNACHELGRGTHGNAKCASVRWRRLHGACTQRRKCQ